LCRAHKPKGSHGESKKRGKIKHIETQLKKTKEMVGEGVGENSFVDQDRRRIWLNLLIL
jgi:hypothetical protein